ncbi:helix-turn-helix domain-containing protein [Actinomadura opuntiae]|uniref:helix-turn-helix domain-containing protein n=1 Tax=Actinomadura sp. OS1-43 TaxID=604315 RepID=UPI00334173AD
MRDPLRVPLPGGGAYLTGRGDELVAIALELLWRADARARSGDLACLRATYAAPVRAGDGSASGSTEPVAGGDRSGSRCVHARQAAEALGISSRMVRKLCERGALAAYRSAGRWEIPEDEVRAYAAYRESERA